MKGSLDWIFYVTMLGTLATVLMDSLGIAAQRLWGIPRPNYRLVGRWIGHMGRGRFRHASINAAEPVQQENAIGWITHYLTGIIFASGLLTVWGLEWLNHPTPVPALIVGLGTVAAPFLIMQPAMGSGLAASRTHQPSVARLRSLLNHGFFGIGLYAAAWMIRSFINP